MPKKCVELIKSIYRPLEMERHPNGIAAGDGGVIGADDVGLSRPEGAGGLGGDHVLRVLQADAKEYVAVPVSPADAVRGVERVDLQLKHARGQHLRTRIKVVIKRWLCFKTTWGDRLYRVCIRNQTIAAYD